MELKTALQELKVIRKSMFDLQIKKINGEKGVVSKQRIISKKVKRISKLANSKLKLVEQDHNTSLSSWYGLNLEVLSKLRSELQDKIRNDNKLLLSASSHGNFGPSVSRGSQLFSRTEPSILDNVSSRVVRQNPEIIEAVKKKILMEEKKYSQVLGLFELLKKEVDFILDTKFKKDIKTMRERELISLYTQEIQNLKRQRANVFQRKEGKLVLFDRSTVIEKYENYLIYDDEEREMKEHHYDKLSRPKRTNDEPIPMRMFEPSRIGRHKNRTMMNEELFKNDKTVLKEILDDLENLTKPTREQEEKAKILNRTRKQASRRSTSRLRKKKKAQKLAVKKKKKIKKSLTNLKRTQDEILKQETNKVIQKEYLENSLLEVEEEDKKSDNDNIIMNDKSVKEARGRAIERIKKMQKVKKKEEKSLKMKKDKKWKKRNVRIKQFMIREGIMKQVKKKKRKGRLISQKAGWK